MPQSDVVKLGNLYSQQISRKKALVILLIATPLVGIQWRSFISWHIIIRMFLQVRPCFLQGSRLIMKLIAISAYCYIGTSREYSSPQCDGAGAPSPAAGLAQYPEFVRTIYITPQSLLSPLSSPQLSILVQQQSTSFGLEAFIRARHTQYFYIKGLSALITIASAYKVFN